MKISFVRLTTETLATLGKRVLAISANELSPEIQSHPLLQALAAANADYSAVFDKSTYSGKGNLVAEADVLRDNLYRGMRNSLFGLTKMNGLSTQHDAIDLYSFFEKHGLDLDHYSYGDQTSHMDKLIEDLEKPENKVKISNTHLTESYELMKSAQFNFEKLFSEQMGANAELRKQESASSIRQHLEIALRNYLNVVTAMRKVTGWDDAYTKLNEAVKAARNSRINGKDVPPTATVE